MLVRDFDYTLPPEQIAQQPLADRAASRMLRVDRTTGASTDSEFRSLPEHLHPGDLLILNDTRVLPAKLFARRAGLNALPAMNDARHLQGAAEVLLTTQHAPFEWAALVRPGRKIPVGETLYFYLPADPDDADADKNPTPLLTARITARGEFGERRLQFAPVPDFYAILDRLGHMPLPPYIHRPRVPGNDQLSDKERYQTVFAAQLGAAAAPTAGLHFTPEILNAIRARGVQIAYITLHVGLGTFQPVRVERLDQIQLHAERYTLPAETAAAINLAMQEGRRIIAVGTTTVRTLEHCAHVAEIQAAEAQSSPPHSLHPHSGETKMFISPGYRFRIVSGLLTNFHLPQSTLLMLVCAFGGQQNVLAAYNHAVHHHYRFFSYGDCMFLA